MIIFFLSNVFHFFYFYQEFIYPIMLVRARGSLTISLISYRQQHIRQKRHIDLEDDVIPDPANNFLSKLKKILSKMIMIENLKNSPSNIFDVILNSRIIGKGIIDPVESFWGCGGYWVLNPEWVNIRNVAVSRRFAPLALTSVKNTHFLAIHTHTHIYIHIHGPTQRNKYKQRALYFVKLEVHVYLGKAPSQGLRNHLNISSILH